MIKFSSSILSSLAISLTHHPTVYAHSLLCSLITSLSHNLYEITSQSIKMKKRLASTIDDSTKLDRKTIERNRRIHMKSLCHQLGSLIPPNLKPPKSKLMLGQQDQLDLAARYIKHMRERIEKLERQKEQAMLNQNSDRKMLDKNVDTKLPILELRDLGSGIEVMLVSGLNKTFMLYEVISVLEEEGAEVVTASFSTVGDKLFYVVHAQVKISRVGVETTRVKDRLQEFIAPLEIWPEDV